MFAEKVSVNWFVLLYVISPTIILPSVSTTVTDGIFPKLWFITHVEEDDCCNKVNSLSPAA